MLCAVTNSLSQFTQFPAVLHQCHPDSTLGEQNSDQSLHLRIETDSHNQRLRAIEVLAALLPRQQAVRGGIINSSLRLAVGGLVQWFSLVGCSALRDTQKVVRWFPIYLDLVEAEL